MAFDCKSGRWNWILILLLPVRWINLSGCETPFNNVDAPCSFANWFVRERSSLGKLNSILSHFYLQVSSVNSLAENTLILQLITTSMGVMQVGIPVFVTGGIGGLHRDGKRFIIELQSRSSEYFVGFSILNYLRFEGFSLFLAKVKQICRVFLTVHSSWYIIWSYWAWEDSSGCYFHRFQVDSWYTSNPWIIGRCSFLCILLP